MAMFDSYHPNTQTLTPKYFIEARKCPVIITCCPKVCQSK